MRASLIHPLLVAGLALSAVLAGCAPPPADRFASQTVAPGVAITLGKDSAGEDCSQTSTGTGTAAIFCGALTDQPSASIQSDSAPARPNLEELATSSSWRAGVDRRYHCEAPQPQTLLGNPGMLLKCTEISGLGGTQYGLVTVVRGRVWYAIGLATALPVMERGMGVASGQIAASAAATTETSIGLIASRLANAAFTSNDINQYQELARAANTANLAGDYAQSELAYRAIESLQTRVLGPNAPALARTLAGEALQISNQHHCDQSGPILARAAELASSPEQPDLSMEPLVAQYRGLEQLDCGTPRKALAYLDQAEQGYDSLLPPAALAGRASNSLQNQSFSNDLVQDDSTYFPLYGVIETRRAKAIAYRRLGEDAKAVAEARSAATLLVARGLDNDSKLAGRVYRTEAMSDEVVGDDKAALALLLSASTQLAQGLPGSNTYAETVLLLAAREAASGEAGRALASCRTAIGVLRDAEQGASPDLLEPCLELMAEQAKTGNAAALYREMFEAAQLAQDSTTAQQIAKATARLAETARDPKIGALIRSREDLIAQLSALNAQRDEEANQGKQDTALFARIADLRARQAATELALAQAAPNYSQLVQGGVSAAKVFAALHPNEAFLATELSAHKGWSFLLRNGTVTAAPIAGGETAVAALVKRIRASMDADQEPPPPFDIAAAQQLYTLVMGGVADRLAGVTDLTVAPSGSLLSVPWALLLTGPADPKNLSKAPWLIEKLAIAHVPAAANFVSLRKLASAPHAPLPWFGFGDFQPVTLQQAEATYPVQNCGDSARLFASLPPLPGAERELAAARAIMGGGNELLGADFTAAAVMKANLKPYRVLHFATHALLPTDLKCQTEPALVTSPPPGATNASGALLTASEVANLDLNADAVLLSACNTGGPAGSLAGESLTGLARSFFYAGARALLVTHWSVNDRYMAYLVALTLNNDRTDPKLGLEGALAKAQRTLLAQAIGDKAESAHPFYWAPLALIGEGS